MKAGKEDNLGWQIYCLHMESVDLVLTFAALSAHMDQYHPAHLDAALAAIETELVEERRRGR